MIRETLVTRYHCNYKDPIPILQEKVEELLADDGHYLLLNVVKNVEDALSSRTDFGHVILTAGHPTDLEAAGTVLRGSSLVHQKINSLDDLQHPREHVGLLVGASNTAEDILKEMPEGSTLIVLESSWKSLCNQIHLFGDNIPRQGNIGKSSWPGRRLSLYLASWAANTHATQHSAATMNSWTGLVDLTEFSELVVPPKIAAK